MDRMHLWRRVWLRLQGKSSRTYTMASRTMSAPEPSNAPSSATLSSRYQLTRRPFSFISLSVATGSSVRPKCLLDIDCTNLLTGGSNQYEDFSSTCWLENHLHRFGSPSNLPHANSSSSTSHLITEVQIEPANSSSAGDLSDDEQSYGSVDSAGSGSGTVEFYNQLNSDSGNIINLYRYPYIDPDLDSMDPILPPPYADEPPPTYEEAVAENSLFGEDFQNTDFFW